MAIVIVSAFEALCVKDKSLALAVGSSRPQRNQRQGGEISEYEITFA
jgi:hypothetical protein